MSTFRGFEKKALLATLCVVALMAVGAYLTAGGRGKMTSAASPDGRYEAVLDERACYIDRNFHILLTDNQSGATRKIGWRLSVDQSPSITREHFVWSPDSRYVALVGDRYYVTDEAELPSGDLIALVYDTVDDAFYSNYDFEETYPPFPADRAVQVFGKAIKKPAPAI